MCQYSAADQLIKLYVNSNITKLATSNPTRHKFVIFEIYY